MDYVKVTVDQKNKLIKAIWSGKPDLKGVEDGCNAVQKELERFSKGEPSLLADVRDLDVRLLPPGSDKVIHEGHMFAVSHCKRQAQVVSSLMMQKSLAKVQQGDTFAQFSTEQEAIRWLLGM